MTDGRKMLRLLAHIATVGLIAASGLAGHGLAAERSIAARPDPTGFGSNVAEVVPVRQMERWLGGGPMKKVPCPVAGTLTLCYVSR
jgi:hypothetical protein